MAMLAWSAMPACRAEYGTPVRAGPRQAGPRIARLNWGNPRSEQERGQRRCRAGRRLGGCCLP